MVTLTIEVNTTIPLTKSVKNLHYLNPVFLFFTLPAYAVVACILLVPGFFFLIFKTQSCSFIQSVLLYVLSYILPFLCSAYLFISCILHFKCYINFLLSEV